MVTTAVLVLLKMFGIPTATPVPITILKILINFDVPPTEEIYLKIPPFLSPKIWNKLDETNLRSNKTSLKISLFDKLINEKNVQNE